MCRDRNVELTRPVDVVPVVMGIDDARYGWEIASFQFRSKLKSQTRTVAGIDQQALVAADDHANAALYSRFIGVMRQ
jgi:hypothetical protein